MQIYNDCKNGKKMCGQCKKYGGGRPTLVPVGVDQDPHIRLCRDIAQAHRLYNVTITKDNRIGVFIKIDENIEKLLDNAEKILNKLQFTKINRITDYKAIYINDAKKEDIPLIDEALVKTEPFFGGYGFFTPSSTYHRFITGLTGGKMSSSNPESAIFLTDTYEQAKKKIMNCKTGGAVTLEEQKKNGGKPDECVIYELFLYHLIEDDNELMQIYNDCKNGKKMCGQCKKYAEELMEKMLIDIQNKRKTAEGKIKKYLE